MRTQLVQSEEKVGQAIHKVMNSSHTRRSQSQLNPPITQGTISQNFTLFTPQSHHLLFESKELFNCKGKEHNSSFYRKGFRHFAFSQSNRNNPF